MQKKPRDVVVVRVSEQGDREDEHFHSPEVQLAKRQAVERRTRASGVVARLRGDRRERQASARQAAGAC